MASPENQRGHYKKGGKGPFVRHHLPAEVSGPPILLVHGTADRGASFARIRRLLAGHHLLTIDRRGYGRSRSLAPCHSVEAGAKDLLECLPSPAVLIGHSFGGLLSLAAAAADPERVLAVGVFEAPAPWLLDDPTDVGPSVTAALNGRPDDAAERFLRSMLGNERWESLSPRIHAERRLESHAVLSDVMAANRSEPPFDLHEVWAPVLVGRGTESPFRLRQAAGEMARRNGWKLEEAFGEQHGAHLSNPRWFATFIRHATEMISF